MNILLVDDHILFREGLKSLLASQPDLNVIGQAKSVQEAVRMTDELQPDLILMDFGLPDGTGLDATNLILGKNPGVQIVFLTVHEEDDRLFDAIRIGAKGYLLKNVSPATLLSYIRGAARGEAALTPDMTSKLMTEYARSQQSPPPKIPL